ncbi:FAST kinase domain-containing protein 4 [Eupeodes corollae]|uniref:FAST kinase domain-containing protein 4 n=1 Tax=Eupeodes corollae TaxID=290404 RepID=UPI00248F908F|nr:FAST kinase domain-containing protein 4 [Eupeodes corollae]XP_055903870.1 FAST kinase domain-containing protein 4 [Eupeodes corollae]XP_055903871.1 FAST kinase domain-containing protein 4 [Eupeodes corollae]XP_055903872.1 FAST kinase domain-containing protein 4 [Eupeodes corollae]
MLGLQRIAGGFSTRWLRRSYSSSVKTATIGSTTPTTSSSEAPTSADASEKPPKSRIVAAAFESLKEDDNAKPAAEQAGTSSASAAAVAANSAKINNIDERILNAKTVNGLLSVSENSTTISRKHALKIVSILAEWSSANRVRLSEFENDSRFIKVCKILGKNFPKNGNVLANSTSTSTTYNNNNNSNKRISGFRTDDLNTVLGVAGDDEAAKLIASISVPQMVKVMSTLAQRKRRSTPLLRSLAYNISSSTDPLDIKQSADVLFAMASLNFQDSVLAAKICSDIQAVLPKTDKSAVVGSVLTSLGILKYRDLDVLEVLTQWVLKNSEICRPQDLSAYFITSAILNFQSTASDEVRSKLLKSLVKEDFTKKYDWLNHVWALGLLNLADSSLIESVLSDKFIEELGTEMSGLTPNAKMKLLNLNSIVQIDKKQVTGLPKDSSVFDLQIAHSKSKQIQLNAMMDALKSLLPSNNHVQPLVNTRMGFLIDALCAFDAKRNPLPLDKENPNSIKVALMLVDFHDICHGPHRSVSGITKLSFDLLEKSGHKVLPVPYNEFSVSDKLLKRVQYLEGKFKSIIRLTN